MSTATSSQGEGQEVTERGWRAGLHNPGRGHGEVMTRTSCAALSDELLDKQESTICGFDRLGGISLAPHSEMECQRTPKDARYS